MDALKHGFISSPVWAELNGTGDDVLLSVRNTGKPIAPQLLPRLFVPLVREDSAVQAPSVQLGGANLGLGLYVLREIATTHGGTVEVTSCAHMTEFRLRLPRVFGTANTAPTLADWVSAVTQPYAPAQACS